MWRHCTPHPPLRVGLSPEGRGDTEGLVVGKQREAVLSGTAVRHIWGNCGRGHHVALAQRWFPRPFGERVRVRYWGMVDVEALHPSPAAARRPLP